MPDILKGLSGGWAFLFSWIFPSAISWTVFSFFAFPRLQYVQIFDQIGDASSVNKALALAGASIFTGLLLSGLSTVLFRVIEAYYLVPEPIAAWMRARQLRKRQVLTNELEQLQQIREEYREPVPATEESSAGRTVRIAKDVSPSAGSAVDHQEATIGIDVKIGLMRERLLRYPTDDRQLGPTQFANALRAIETYGWDRYRLDSQMLWSELISVVPDALRPEEEAARAPVNFSVSMVYLSVLTGAACVAVGVATPGSPTGLVAVGIVFLLLVPAWYRLAVLSTRYLGSVVRAVINLGRVELANKMGLVIPRKLQDEREMWERAFWFVQESFDERYASDLNPYRSEDQEDEDPK